jgi:O-antigen/teichoic acid export membrane protein
VGYLRDTVRGLTWVGGFRGVNRLAIFAKTVILARLLTPTEFGVFGIAGVVMAFLEVLAETGINVFLVQEREDIDDYINTAWVVSILRGILISAVLLASASLVSQFFQTPASRGLLVFIAIVPLVRGFINPAVVKFQKELKFARQFWYNLAILAVDTGVSVIFAYLTHSAYALAYGLLAGVVLELVMSFFVIRPRPKLAVSSEKVRKIIGRGKWVTAYGIFSYLFQNGDNMVVGRLLGAGSLGLYSVAYKISSLPISEIADIFSKVTFPVYVKIADDPARLKRAAFRVIFLASVLVTGVGAGVFLFARPIVVIVLGPNWLAAVSVLKVLSVFGIVKGIDAVSQNVLLALQKQNYIAVITFIGLLGLFIPIIPLTLKFGLTGTGISVIIGSVVSLPVTVYYLIRVFREPDLTK